MVEFHKNCSVNPQFSLLSLFNFSTFYKPQKLKSTARCSAIKLKIPLFQNAQFYKRLVFQKCPRFKSGL